MSNDRVYRTKGKETIKYYRGIFPYSEIVTILKEDGEAFFEDSRDEPLRRQTVWKASRRLSEMVGKRVVAEHRLLRMDDGEQKEGYLFRLVDQQSLRLKEHV